LNSTLITGYKLLVSNNCYSGKYNKKYICYFKPEPKLTKNNYIQNLIKQGENQFQDFKFVINDSKKIARSLVAFANTKGGRLLIGVKDNGKIAGVQTDEEYHMVEAAAQLYCRPEITFERKDWLVDGKKVLEIIIPESENKPHLTQTDKNKWLAFMRVCDENILANVVVLKAWKKLNREKGIKIQYADAEKFLLNYLQKEKYIDLKQFYKKAKISRYRAINILSDFIALGIIDTVFIDNNICYRSLPSEMVL